MTRTNASSLLEGFQTSPTVDLIVALLLGILVLVIVLRYTRRIRRKGE